MDEIDKIIARENQTGVSIAKQLGKGAPPDYKALFARVKTRRRANAAKHFRRVIWKPDYNRLFRSKYTY